MEKKDARINAVLDRDFLDVSLVFQGKMLGKMKTANDRNLSRKTLPLLDGFFKKNNIDASSISDVKLESELPDTFTSFRIVKVILESIKWNHARFCQGEIFGQANNIRKFKG